MIIHYLNEEPLASLKANVNPNLKQYAKPDNSWITEFCDGENPFSEYKVEVEDFSLSPATGTEFRQGTYDVNNIIRMYSAMKNLTDTQATDERLWAGLSHGDLYGYMHERWKGKKTNTDPESTILSRYFFKGSKRRAIFMNSLSRLWWIGRLTYDENRKDPFELTRYMEKEFTTKSTFLFSNTFTSNPAITHGLIAALMDLEKRGYKYGSLPRDVFLEALRFLNVLGGTRLLDYYSSDEIEDRVREHMLSLNPESKKKVFVGNSGKV